MSLRTAARGVRGALWRHIHARWRILAVGLALGLVPLALEAPHLFQPGFPYLGDGISNLYPVLHARHSIQSGQLPLYTDLWYGGEPQFANPLWKALYPPMWPAYIPGVPLLPTIKATLAAHYVAVPMVAYWYARQDFPAAIALPFALVFVLPMAAFGGHYEKVLAWPWVVLLIWQCTPPRLRRPHRAGLLAGVALGAMVTAGGLYWAFYAGCLFGAIAVAIRSWPFVRGTIVGALVGLPKVLLSVVPALLGGATRPPVAEGLTIRGFTAGLAGFWLDASELSIAVQDAINHEGYAVVGLPIILLAASGLVYGWYTTTDAATPTRWLLGVAAAGLLGTLLASGWAFLYADLVPIIPSFRVAPRAIVLVGAATLLAAWFALRVAVRPPRDCAVVGLVALLCILAVVSGSLTGAAIDTGSAQPIGAGERIADDIAAAGYESVWVEGAIPPWRLSGTHPRIEQRAVGGARPGTIPTPYQKQIGYHLTRRDVSLAAVNYGRIGQHYSTRRSGEFTFDALVLPIKIPADSRLALTGGWTAPVRGHITPLDVTLVEVYHTDAGVVYLYAPHPHPNQSDARSQPE